MGSARSPAAAAGAEATDIGRAKGDISPILTAVYFHFFQMAAPYLRPAFPRRAASAFPV